MQSFCYNANQVEQYRKGEKSMKEEKASSTAFSVVQGILYTAQNPQLAHLVPEDLKDACARILSASPEGRKRQRQLDSRWFM